MNPDLKKYLDDFMSKNPTATQEDVRGVTAAWMQAHTEASSASSAPAAPPAPMISKVINAAYQGLTMGWGDELMGLIGGDKARDQVRDLDKQFRDEHPVADIGTKIVAGALPFVMGGGEAKGAGLLYNMIRGAKIGAATGAVSGAGEGTDADSRIKGAATGGAVGGLFGAAVPGGVALARQVGGAGTAATRRLAAAIAKSGGVNKVGATLDNFAANGRGDVVTLADLSPELASEADFAANNSEDSFNAFVKKLGLRQKGASDRLQSDVQGHLGTLPDADATMQALQNSRRGWAAQAYSNLPLDEEIPKGALQDAFGGAFKQPAVKSALRQARLAGDLDPNSPLGAAVGQLDPATLQGMTLQQAVQSGVLVPGGAGGVQTPGAAQAAAKRLSTWDDVHQLKQIFDDRATSAFSSGKGALGRAYATLRDATEGALNQHVDGYEQVTAAYKNRMDLERALTAGGKMWDKVDSRGLAREVVGMSPDELAAYRTGLASRMVAKLQNVSTNRNEAGAYANASENLQNKLRIVFGDEPTFKRFMQQADAENQLNKLKNVVGNSATYRRGAAAGDDPLALALDVSRSASRGGGIYSLITLAQRLAHGAAAKKTATALGPMLLTEGEPAIRQAMDRIVMQPPGVGRFAGNVAPAAFGRAAGLFGQQQP